MASCIQYFFIPLPYPLLQILILPPNFLDRSQSKPTDCFHANCFSSVILTDQLHDISMLVSEDFQSQ